MMTFTLFILSYLAIGLTAGRIIFRKMWDGIEPRFTIKNIDGFPEKVPVSEYKDARFFAVGAVLIWPVYAFCGALYVVGAIAHWLLRHSLLRDVPAERKNNPSKPIEVEKAPKEDDILVGEIDDYYYQHRRAGSNENATNPLENVIY